MLNPLKAVNIFPKWKRTLESIKDYLGSIEEQIEDIKKLTQQIFEIFSIEPFHVTNNRNIVRVYKSKMQYLSAYTFTIQCNETTLNIIAQISNFMNEVYQLEDNCYCSQCRQPCDTCIRGHSNLSYPSKICKKANCKSKTMKCTSCSQEFNWENVSKMKVFCISCQTFNLKCRSCYYGTLCSCYNSNYQCKSCNGIL